MKAFSILLALSLIVSCGTLNKSQNCTPTLFPYSEYSYTPEVVELKKVQSEDSIKNIIKTKSIEIPVFDGWVHEEVPSIGHKFTKNEKGFYISYEKDSLPHKIDKGEIQGINIVGCTNFKTVESVTKTNYEFFQDLYFITSENLPKNKGFWTYWILYNKTKYFKDISDLKYYKGEKLIVFKRTPLVKCKENPIFEIFLKATKESKSFSMGANFQNEIFFKNFFEALNYLN